MSSTPPQEQPADDDGDPYTLAAAAVEELHREGVAPWLLDRFAGLVREGPESLAGVLTQSGGPVTLDGTRACCRCHFVTVDPHGRPRVDGLAERLARRAQDYCIPRTRVAEAAAEFNRTRSTAAFSALEAEARALFVKLEKSGEGGELLLYLLLEAVLGLPQLLCKMPLKTSTEMHVHGVDGVHGRLLPDGVLALYWGESKMYGRVNQAIDSCFQSIAPYLTDDGGGPARRDLLLVRDHLDPGDEELKAALVRYFDDSQPESARVEFRGACLVGFKHEDYPASQQEMEDVGEELAARVAGWHERIGKRVGAHGLESFELEVFCVPLPSVEEFRTALAGKLGLR